MARSRQPFAPNLQKVLDRAPAPVARDLFNAPRRGSGPIVDFADLDPACDTAGLVEFVGKLDQDVLKELDDICRQVVDLSDAKGATSLTTVVNRKLYNTDIATYDAQPDELCKSIWVYTKFHNVFLDAQSFYTARRYRDHGKLYSAFEVADDASMEFAADGVDGEVLARRIGEALDLPSKSTVTAIDLPDTDTHPSSVMVAVRHGGALSSIQDHRDDGLRETRYYRPAEEAILIYTPSLRKLEVCARGYVVRDHASRAFAEVVLGQDLKSKPLTGRNFNLDRFGRSLQLPLPELEDVEIIHAKVTEIETRLGSWKRRLLLQVTIDDDIEDFANRFMGTTKAAASRFGYSRVAIAVAYKYRESGESGTLKLWVSSGNTSNAQNERDPKLRDLSLRLLEAWGIMNRQRLLDERERAFYFDDLLFLFDYPENEVAGAVLSNAGVDRKRLLSAQLLGKKGRQDIVLIDDDDGPVEAELDTGARQGTLTLEGSFGEDLGAVSEDDHVIYRINRAYLSEIVIDALKRELGASRATVSSDHIAEFGDVPIGFQTIPIYLVRALASLKKPEDLDLEFRRRHLAGPGLILSAGDTGIRYLGANVVIPLRRVISLEGDEIVLDPGALEQAYRSGQLLVMAGDAPQIILHGPKHATLHIPSRPPFNLFGETKILLFQRLVDAALNGEKDVRTSELMRGMGSKSPRQLFQSSEWAALHNAYICSVRTRTWRLCEDAPPPI
ncbi:hypothetical protein OEZ60_13065 [Defluviimonas sp. WL0024]|uniref:AIPR protein n=1 Tax=Albidovulum salinarum TaxID=2984153 RepID=A0ABT2XB20_9RHOB|nr:hypothetical protein [Defluviimonas sp. WL0024]MCU9848935.1 hypothetical protein [Defluviimonas sp. WL0024]